MKKKYTIKVTQNHINKGSKFNTQSCPLAMAFHAAGLRRWMVNANTAGPPTKAFSNRLPWAAAEFRQGFDAGYTVKPFEFTIEVGK